MNRYPATVMPREVLFGTVAQIEAWCHANNKVRPTLADLALARIARRKS